MPRLADPVPQLVLAVAAVCVAMSWGWGFTVDDALISTRVAHHIANGIGYRFNPSGDVVDAVTPLGWAFVLTPLSLLGPWFGLLNARWFGVTCTLGWAFVLGWASRGRKPANTALALLPLSLCLPVGAWSVSGMETPLIALLVSLTLLESRARFGFAGAAAALRPELIPWALSLALFFPSLHPARKLLRTATVLALPLTVAVVRLTVFGHAAPLAVFAKPATLQAGLFYVAASALWLGLPALTIGYRAFRTLSPAARAIALSLVVHAAAVLVAGGDWMALFRLFIPICPLLVWLGIQLNESSRWRDSIARSAVACGVSIALLAGQLDATRGVLTQRQQLVQQGAMSFAGSLWIATLDVGWVGAATRAPVLDLSGVTTPEVAVLPGGHTSKQLPRDFLLRYQPDTLVLLLAPGIDQQKVGETADWRTLPFARVVEQRLSRLDGARAFVPTSMLALRGTTQHYLVLERLGERMATRAQSFTTTRAP